MSNLNDSVMNKSHRDQTQFSPEKKESKKEMGLVLFAYSLSAIRQTDKQASDIEAPGLHAIQYYNI